MQLYEININSINVLWIYRYSDYQSLWDWDEAINDILNIIPFNLAVKYDKYWTHSGEESEFYSDAETDDIDLYLNKNGKILNYDPLIWKFINNSSLTDIVFGFLNADIGLLGYHSCEINFKKALNIKKKEFILEFWAENTDYFLTSLIDSVGICFVSKDKNILEQIKEKIIAETKIEGIIEAIRLP
ncbi:hypothetical protein [Desulfonema ishimotonii]|uniref:hypothetical protein n=1 Tax=Desulfonema ishimotonii TaxID=45657 RepID=UPI000F571F4E|nr:hypothetical protein [Desulfonema ishimotonii]